MLFDVGSKLFAASQAKRPATGPGLGLSGPVMSKMTAAPITGTKEPANFRPRLFSTHHSTTPSAAAKPKTLLPHNTTPWHSTPEPLGPKAAASLVPGAPPRTAMAPREPLGGRITVTPVAFSSSVQQPTSTSLIPSAICRPHVSTSTRNIECLKVTPFIAYRKIYELTWGQVSSHPVRRKVGLNMGPQLLIKNLC